MNADTEKLKKLHDIIGDIKLMHEEAEGGSIEKWAESRYADALDIVRELIEQADGRVLERTNENQMPVFLSKEEISLIGRSMGTHAYETGNEGDAIKKLAVKLGLDPEWLSMGYPKGEAEGPGR